MENIHILQTKEPTRIFETNTGLQFSIIDKVRAGEYKGFHIYITSDCEFKEGDWFYDNLFEQICMFDVDFKLNSNDYEDCKKIILTTDPTLIADGVQAINDEFVEWFVKNPSCEWVDVETYTNKIGVEYDANGYREMDVFGKEYRIKIPQEEPKQDHFQEMNDFMIKGTLEKAAENYANNWEDIHPTLDWEDMAPIAVSRIDFKAGAYWKVERMYSEEEKELMIKIFHSYWFENNPEHEDNLKEWELSKKLFEQFKKK